MTSQMEPESAGDQEAHRHAKFRPRQISNIKRRIKALPMKDLAKIALYAFGGLYVDMNDGQETINPDKEVSGADYIQYMTAILGRHGLIPDQSR